MHSLPRSFLMNSTRTSSFDVQSGWSLKSNPMFTNRLSSLCSMLHPFFKKLQKFNFTGFGREKLWLMLTNISLILSPLSSFVFHPILDFFVFPKTWGEIIHHSKWDAKKVCFKGKLPLIFGRGAHEWMKMMTANKLDTRFIHQFYAHAFVDIERI